jgi:cytochrome c
MRGTLVSGWTSRAEEARIAPGRFGGVVVNRHLASMLLVAASLFATEAGAAGDASKGQAVFQRCAICHRAEKGGGNGLGPNLFGIVGRKAGTVPGFAYSASMKNAGIAWTADKLAAYIAHPAAVVPGNRMSFAGIGNPQMVNDLIAYLATLK